MFEAPVINVVPKASEKIAMMLLIEDGQRPGQRKVTPVKNERVIEFPTRMKSVVPKTSSISNEESALVAHQSQTPKSEIDDATLSTELIMENSVIVSVETAGDSESDSERTQDDRGLKIIADSADLMAEQSEISTAWSEKPAAKPKEKRFFLVVFLGALTVKRLPRKGECLVRRQQ